MIICYTAEVHNNFMSVWAKPRGFQKEIWGAYGSELNTRLLSPLPARMHMMSD